MTMPTDFTMTRADWPALLGGARHAELLAAAYRQKCAVLGRRVGLRGLIECGNVCAKDCFYCGIRRSNPHVTRYQMAADEILASAAWAAEHGYGSIVLQSGEIESEAHTALIEDVLRRLHARWGDTLGITLSLGEQTPEVYRRWRAAGAHRYLLRIETSNPELYARLHPADHAWTRRVACLRALKDIGYITGTGVMIGLPGQTLEDLAADIDFFCAADVDMIGMGPYLPHPETPLARAARPDFPPLETTLRMIALVRLVRPDVNIAATTALQVLAPDGREQGLRAGANVVMPNVTPSRYRGDYLLYPGKPCTHDSSEFCRACLARRIASVGEEIAWGARVDPLHARGGHT